MSYLFSKVLPDTSYRKFFISDSGDNFTWWPSSSNAIVHCTLKTAHSYSDKLSCIQQHNNIDSHSKHYNFSHIFIMNKQCTCRRVKSGTTNWYLTRIRPVEPGICPTAAGWNVVEILSLKCIQVMSSWPRLQIPIKMGSGPKKWH